MSNRTPVETRTGSGAEIRIGLDTGGTYTDAVALDGRRVVASAKVCPQVSYRRCAADAQRQK